MDDIQIVELFFARSEKAIGETEKKYGRYCRYIAKNILGNDEDAEEIANDTYLKVWNTIPPNRPESLKAYVGMISNRLALNRYKKYSAEKRGRGDVPLVLDELAECVSDSESDINAEIDLRDALNRFLRSLPRKTRNIFVRRYWYAASVEEICEEFGMKKSSVTVLMMRTRNELKEFLKKEGFEV